MHFRKFITAIPNKNRARPAKILCWDRTRLIFSSPQEFSDLPSSYEEAIKILRFFSSR